MRKIMRGLRMLRRYGQTLGPYLMLEILLPGGSLFALALFVIQRRKLTTAVDSTRIIAPACARADRGHGMRLRRAALAGVRCPYPQPRSTS